jgi:hypothetical protein
VPNSAGSAEDGYSRIWYDATVGGCTLVADECPGVDDRDQKLTSVIGSR